ncbi:hypothetical protein, partial [Roseiflexus castenholzii]|uniref:hypothetical protein n=1 Tax=Roseiflexus castenholzii TaxID=120962 RepID=UPI003C79AA06
IEQILGKVEEYSKGVQDVVQGPRTGASGGGLLRPAAAARDDSLGWGDCFDRLRWSRNDSVG